jgi:hypothetical protein
MQCWGLETREQFSFEDEGTVVLQISVNSTRRNIPEDLNH